MQFNLKNRTVNKNLPATFQFSPATSKSIDIPGYDHICKKKVQHSWNENFNLLHYVEWDRIVTLAGAKAN
jgi:hypothetical protein